MCGAETLPDSVHCRPQRLVYYDIDPFGEPVKLTASSLFPTINGAARGTLSHKNSENSVERLARVRHDSQCVFGVLFDTPALLVLEQQTDRA